MSFPLVPAARAADAAYALAFLSSAAIEVAAVAFLLFLAVSAVLGRASLPTIWSGVWRGVEQAGLHKLAIPLVCLTLSVWGLAATRGG